MTKKKIKQHTSFNDDLEKLKKTVNLGSTETINISNKDIITEEKRQIIISSKNLSISFKYMTENNDYNFSYIKKDKSIYKEFITGMSQTFKLITSKKVKDLEQPPFKDKFGFYNLKSNVYKCSGKIFEGIEQIISVEFGSKHSPFRVILYRDPEIGNENVLYVLCFQFSFNSSIYNH